MQKHDIIVVGSSAGGLKPLIKLVTGLPPDLDASIFIMRHFPSGEHSDLPGLLSIHGPVRATNAINGESIKRNRIYVAPSNRQFGIEPVPASKRVLVPYDDPDIPGLVQTILTFKGYTVLRCK